MARFARSVRIFLIAAAALVAVLIVLLVVLTRTDFGVEQAGRFAVERLRSAVNGELRVGSVTSRGLLRGVTLHGVAIDDEEGRPFLRADSARLSYHLLTLVGGDLAFDRLVVYAPEVTIERLPGQDEWNFRRVFPGDTLAPDTAASGLLLIDDATIMDGLVVVRVPWEPELPVDPGDTARILLEDVPGGVARVFRFEEINGRLPRVVWDSPDEDAQIFRIGQLATRAYIWETPVEIRRVEGTMTLRDSVLSFQAPRVQLPGSELDMVGQIILAEGGNRYDIEAEGDDVSFADFQWLYPPLPDEGGGSLKFRIQSRGAHDILWLAEDARLRTGGTEVAGSFGVVTGDSLYFTNVSLEASPLDLQLLQSLLPGTLPLEGLLIGTVEVDGPISALRTRGDLRYRRLGGRPAGSAARWVGTVRAREPYAVSGLEADLTRVDLGQIAELFPSLRLRGLATGSVRADGSLSRGLRLTGELALDRNGSLSTVRGGGQVAVGGNRSKVDLRFEAEPLALDLLGSQFPALARLTGEARGPVTVTGSLNDLRVDADIVTPAGAVVLHGTFALAGPRPRFTADGAVTDFRLDRLVGGLPATTMTGRFDVDAEGQRLQDLEGRAALDVFSAVVDGIPVHTGRVRVRAIDGVAFVDTLDVRSLIGDLAASGSLGLAADRTGQLRFAVVADTLAPLERHLLPPLEVPDTAFFPPARLAGLITAEGTLSGSLPSWTVAGRATATQGVYGEVRARRVEVSGDWTPAADRLTLTGSVDSLTAGTRFLPRGHVEGRYERGSGSLAVTALGPGFQSLEAAAGFTRVEDGARFSLRSMALETRDGRWELADSVAGRAGSRGFGIEPTVLIRNPDGARIELAGLLPWTDARGTAASATAAFTASVENLGIGEVLRIAQADTAIDGVLTGRLTVSGTAASPVMAGVVTGRRFRYHEATVDSLAADLRYRDRSLTGHVAAWRGDEEILRGEGAIPLDLALLEIDGRRLDRPMEVRLTADSVPAALVAFLAPGFTRVEGTLNGAMVLGGTPLAPRFQGELRIVDGSGYFTHSGVHYRRVAATASMRDTELAIDGTLRTGGGSARIRGVLDLEHPRDPRFDLELVGSRLEVSRRRDVVALADSARVFLRGRYSAPVLSGSVRLTEGELNLGEILRQYRIVQLEPWFYEVFDSTAMGFRPPAMSPFLANIRVSDASVTVDRGFWLRGPELDVEVSGQLGVEYDRVAEDLRLSGTLQAVRGTYELRVLQNADFRLLREVPGRRFDIRSGTIDFVGTPGIDLNLAITATYRLRRNQGEPIDVVAQVAGTLQTPRVRLTSESDLPISESDLASYIIFGRSLSELSQSETDVLSTRFDRAGALIMDAFLAPTVSGLASSTLQSVFGFDYVAVTTLQNPN
ncbi:MAG: translocation/assembly module TamB, partial [Gemmatimonadetes bacterium]|nr:translocation/assembly module TamB [Gemmatimonadota bacterium]